MTAPQGLGDGALADAAAADIAAPMAASAAPHLVEPDRSVAAIAAPALVATEPVRAEPAPMASIAKPVMVEAVATAEAQAAFELPVDSLAAMAHSAGLQWVNSDVEKIRAVQAALDNQPAPVRMPRERAPVARVDEGPLVLVETRKDLSQYKLPFETAGQASAAPK